MHQLPIRRSFTHDLLGPEGFPVPVDGRGGSINRQVRSYSSEAFRNRINLSFFRFRFLSFLGFLSHVNNPRYRLAQSSSIKEIRSIDRKEAQFNPLRREKKEAALFEGGGDLESLRKTIS